MGAPTSGGRVDERRGTEENSADRDQDEAPHDAGQPNGLHRNPVSIAARDRGLNRQRSRVLLYRTPASQASHTGTTNRINKEGLQLPRYRDWLTCRGGGVPSMQAMSILRHIMGEISGL